MRPRACTSAPPSLSYPSLTGANPSCLAKSATGAIRIGSQGGRNQVIKTFHELSAGEGLRSEGGGRETAQLFRENSKRIRRVDDRLAFPARQGLRNLARTWAEDLKGTGIRVNVLSPGPTATELAKAALGEEGQKVYASMTPLQRMADPAEIGAAAAFLASEDSSFMTASELAVDGGLAQI